jgi:GT2 family glycosyltransferase
VKVSFVIPLYNCLPLTQVMLASLHATVPRGLEHEIILVDDGSTDGTRAWLATLSTPCRVVLNPQNLGYAGANNAGAAIATGDLLVLLNNDLVLTPHWLEPMLRAHRALGPRAGLVGNIQLNATTGAVDHAGIVINLKTKPEHLTELPPRWTQWPHPTRHVLAVTGACALIARPLWEQLGGFDAGFRNGGEDVDLCLRARAAGRVNAVALRSVIRHHVSASPGRSLRNEQNSRRLATRWRRELEEAPLHRWCWHELDREWTSPREPTEHGVAAALLAYALRLRRDPPAAAEAGMRAAMERELARWAQLLDPSTPTPP